MSMQSDPHNEQIPPQTAPEQPSTPEQNNQKEGAGLDDKIKHIAMAGVGVIVDAVEKTVEAVSNFAKSEKTKEWAQKGEEAVHQVAEAGSQAFQKVKSAITDADAKEKANRQLAQLTDLANKVSSLSQEDREIFRDILRKMDNKTSFRNILDHEPAVDPEDPMGKDPGSEEAIGNPEVQEVEHIQPVDKSTYNPEERELHQFKDPLAHTSPTAPDDDHNTKRAQTNQMNKHLNQNVPPDF